MCGEPSTSATIAVSMTSEASASPAVIASAMAPGEVAFRRDPLQLLILLPDCPGADEGPEASSTSAPALGTLGVDNDVPEFTCGADSDADAGHHGDENDRVAARVRVAP